MNQSGISRSFCKDTILRLSVYKSLFSILPYEVNISALNWTFWNIIKYTNGKLHNTFKNIYLI